MIKRGGTSSIQLSRIQMSSKSDLQRHFGQATAMEVPSQCSRQAQSRVLQLQEFPGSKCSALSRSDCYTWSTGTSPYCQLRPGYNGVVCSSCGSFPLRRNSVSSSFLLYSVKLLGMRQHIPQPFIFHLDIGIVKASLHYQCRSWRRERKRNQQENRKLPKVYKVNLGSKTKFWIISSRWL